MRRILLGFLILWGIVLVTGFFSTPLYNGWPQENPPAERHWRSYILVTNDRIQRIQEAEKRFRVTIGQYKTHVITPIQAARELKAATMEVRSVQQEMDFNPVAEEFSVFHGRFYETIEQFDHALEQTVLYFKDLDQKHLVEADAAYKLYKEDFKADYDLFLNLVRNERQVS